jgi:hypothetical protein
MVVWGVHKDGDGRVCGSEAKNPSSSLLHHTPPLHTLPALAVTTSVPPSWVRLVRASMSASLRALLGVGTACSGEEGRQQGWADGGGERDPTPGAASWLEANPQA